MGCRVVLLAGGFIFVSCVLAAQSRPEERIPVRDPDELAALRLPRDAKNVYRWSGAGQQSGRSQDAAAVQAPEAWGAAPGYTTVMGYELMNFYASYLRRRMDSVYCEENPGIYPAQEGWAQLDLPDGANLAQFQFWAYDEEPNYGLTFQVFETCQASGSGPPAMTLIASADTFGSIGYYFGFTPFNDYKVNNRDCGYSVRVIFIEPDVACRSDRLQVNKMQVSWVRQVSPAPAAATFADVPAGHALFQYVEALAKSGITSGCGNGNFCPDTPLTRGQMAVFVARGLGLSWP